MFVNFNESFIFVHFKYEEVDMIHDFEKFYDDVIREFQSAGTVVMFKVKTLFSCCDCNLFL